MEKSCRSAESRDKVKKCAKHSSSSSHSRAQERSPGRATPPRPSEAPAVTSSTPVSRRSHHANCKKLSRSHSTSSSTSSSRPPATSLAPSAPVVITQYKERGDALVTEAEAKLR